MSAYLPFWSKVKCLGFGHSSLKFCKYEKKEKKNCYNSHGYSVTVLLLKTSKIIKVYIATVMQFSLNLLMQRVLLKAAVQD